LHRTQGNYGTAQGMGTPQNQVGYQWGPQAGSQWGQQQGQTGAQWGQSGLAGGFQSPTGQMAGQQMLPKFGAAELLMAREVACQHIDVINHFEIYRPLVRDQRLQQIVDSQTKHLFTGYQNLVNFLHNQGMSSAVPYRAPKSFSAKYGLRQPSPVVPNVSNTEMDDRDIALGMLYHVKASAMQCTIAALECINPDLRNMITNCAVSAINQAYEILQFMNERGFYQIPTLADQTTQTMINTYQPGTQPQFI